MHRWGRNIEVPSEDPFLAGQLGAAMVRGLQGSAQDSEYVIIITQKITNNNNNTNNDIKITIAITNNMFRFVKLLASIKHFTAYSLENSDGHNRFGFNPNISLRDMAESYLPAFKATIVQGGVLGMMCSYVRTMHTI